MKNILILFSLITLFSCTQKDSSVLILGKWEADSVHVYTNGELLHVLPDSRENDYLGTIENPAIAQFTEYGEFFQFRKNSDNKNFREYTIDSLQPNIILENQQRMAKIIDVNSENLILEFEIVPIPMNFFEDKSTPKRLITMFYHKID